MQWTTQGLQRVEELVSDYRLRGGKPLEAEKLRMTGVQGKDVYNIAGPIKDDGEWVIPGRVESRDSEISEIQFFVRRGEVWEPRIGAPVYALQDPFFTFIGGELVLGGVQTFPHPEREGHLGWRTVMMKGASIAELKPFFQGPDFMKDLRLVELADGGIGIFTRPQGAKGGRGQIGFARVDRLADLSIQVVDDAPVFDQFAIEEWGGANEVHRLANGKLGVLGHIACFCDSGNRHYYPMVFAVDPQTGDYTPMEIIAERDDFEPGPAKRPDLVDVVFSGGLHRRSDGTADLYAGTSDAEAQVLRIPDPFLKYEQA
ncbi:hypothetical protein PA598K_05998 [Paenibacillus sp. 598K]|uniref:DUF1861 family protein n=1 Tax=Paenibacillus sp. 598K TaxID=1117987 RepID=UPI000FF9E61A|nr:DUF1861 family protein [Paenibacillus sp. 598K]GBF77446.1 hypothetical protein PA598K_05998 [Paenibacillus sp. 598K]